MISSEEQTTPSALSTFLSLCTQPWFLLVCIGAGCSLSLGDAYILLVDGGVLGEAMELFYAGELVPPIVFCLMWFYGARLGARNVAARKGFARFCVIGRLFALRPWWVALPAAAILAGAAIALAQMVAPNASDALSGVAAFLMGAGIMTMPFLWADALGALKGGTVVVAVASAIVVSGFIQLVLAFCYAAFSLLLLVALLVFSVLFYLGLAGIREKSPLPMEEKSSVGDEGRSSLPRWQFWRATWIIFLLAVAQFAAMSQIPRSVYSEGSFYQVFVALGVMLAGCVGIWLASLVKRKQNGLRLMLVMGVLVVVALFLCGMLLGTRALASVFFYASKRLVFLLVFVNAFRMADPCDRGRLFALPSLLLVVAWFVRLWTSSLAASVGIGGGIAENALATLALVFAAAVLTLALADTTPDESGEAPTENGDAEMMRERAEEIGRAFQLTAREAEVLPYLALGYGSSYIAERLVVSPATVRTHAHNIYVKTGVAGQHELVELVRDGKDVC